MFISMAALALAVLAAALLALVFAPEHVGASAVKSKSRRNRATHIPPKCSILITGNPYLDHGALTTRDPGTWARSLRVLRSSVDLLCRHPELRKHPMRHEYAYESITSKLAPLDTLPPFLASEAAAFSYPVFGNGNGNRNSENTDNYEYSYEDEDADDEEDDGDGDYTGEKRTKIRLEAEKKSCMLGVRMLSIMAEMGPCYLPAEEKAAWPLARGYYDVDSFAKTLLAGNFSRLIEFVPRRVSSQMVLCRGACIRALHIYLPYLAAAKHSSAAAPLTSVDDSDSDSLLAGACNELPENGPNCVDPNDVFLPEASSSSSQK